jgi:hypothetical protein
LDIFPWPPPAAGCCLCQLYVAVRNLLDRLMRHGIIFFFHNKTVSADLSVAKIISRIAL